MSDDEFEICETMWECIRLGITCDVLLLLFPSHLLSNSCRL